MKGWKTWTGVVLVAVSAVISALGANGVIDHAQAKMISELILTVGGAFGLLGLGSKIDKSNK